MGVPAWLHVFTDECASSMSHWFTQSRVSKSYWPLLFLTGKAQSAQPVAYTQTNFSEEAGEHKQD